MKEKLVAIIRIALGWIFFWAFLDKLFGLGFTTGADKSWLAGSSPTAGFLSFGTSGPFAELFQSLAGMVWVDWLFMLGLCLIGCALMLGIGMRIAAVSGSVMLLLMYTAAFMPPEHNPLIDDHIMYTLILLTLPHLSAGDYWGLGKKWKALRLVRKHPWLA